jgi:hypothetical protein
MAHYALLDENNIVTEVIVGKEEGEDGVDWEAWYGEFREQTCKRTSYNTQGGIHLNNGTPFRKNYAGIGYTYRADLDAFVPPQPYPSWILNQETCTWNPPIPKPQHIGLEMYFWNENILSWDVVNEPNN